MLDESGSTLIYVVVAYILYNQKLKVLMYDTNAEKYCEFFTGAEMESYIKEVDNPSLYEYNALCLRWNRIPSPLIHRDIYSEMSNCTWKETFYYAVETGNNNYYVDNRSLINLLKKDEILLKRMPISMLLTFLV